jgi:cell division protein ZapA (FtsZ GTPase activity inhibitor)
VQKQITILDKSYTLRADPGEELEQAASEVESRMKKLLGRSPAVEPYTAALLTALNLASELRSTRRGLREKLGDLERDAAALETVLAAAMREEGE